VGNAGNIIINTGKLEVLNGAELIASVLGEGKAGDIILTTHNLNVNDATIETNTFSSGDAGDIFINTSILNLTNGGNIFAFTKGRGDGGTVTINASDAVNMGEGVQNFAPIISVETSNAGKAGDIIINTPNFTLAETARITATATETATNLDGGGSITLNANIMNLAGIVGIFAETKGQAPAGTLLLQTYQNNPDLNLTLYPNSKISASTFASGNGGDLIVTAPDTININGAGILAVETSGSGNAGNIKITSQNINLSDGVTISASTSSSGNAGNIDITANNFNLSNNSTIQTNTFASGNAGNIKVTVSNDINMNDSQILASTSINSTGNGGNINIDPINTNLNNSRIAVNSQGKGTGGNIFLISHNLNLNNNSAISAETLSTNGGNINLQIGDILWLRGGSNITATAGTALAGGNGGNITIYAPWIIALPNQDSNITAEAFEGAGGNINITTNALFGIGFTGKNILVRNDITASSQFGLTGSVIINTPAVDPTSGLIELPSNLVDADSLFGRDPCALENGQIAGGSSFIIIGKGGLPVNPNETPTNINGTVNLISLDDNNHNQTTAITINNQATQLENNQAIIQQAQGWGITEDEELILTAESLSLTPQNTGFNQLSCQSIK